jgi:hypothetical protein
LDGIISLANPFPSWLSLQSSLSLNHAPALYESAFENTDAELLDLNRIISHKACAFNQVNPALSYYITSSTERVRERAVLGNGETHSNPRLFAPVRETRCSA